MVFDRADRTDLGLGARRWVRCRGTKLSFVFCALMDRLHACLLMGIGKKRLGLYDNPHRIL